MTSKEIELEENILELASIANVIMWRPPWDSRHHNLVAKFGLDAENKTFFVILGGIRQSFEIMKREKETLGGS